METTLYCKGCDTPDLDEEEVEDGFHLGCGGVVERVCTYCLGTGEVTVDEQVYIGEPHMAPIGTRVCICRKQLEIDRAVDEAWKEKDYDTEPRRY